MRGFSMTVSREELSATIARREFLRIGTLAGVGAALWPRLAYAAAQPELLPNIRAFVRRWVSPGRFPGMVASIGLPGRDAEFVAMGSEGFTDADAVTPDSLFRIYSMTKPITGMATMDLIAKGKLALDQPLYDILPAYRQMQVQNTYDGSITELHPAPRPITIRHLLTHTSGLGYPIIQQGPINHLMLDKGLMAGQVSRLEIPGFSWGTPARGLKAFATTLAEVPLVRDPGTVWSYSLGLDVLGAVIEAVSAKPFDVFLRDTIFGPAGMDSTFFQVPSSAAKRLTTNYGVVHDIFIPIDKGSDSIFLDQPAFPMGGAGLVSSPRDYDRFLRMLAQGGELGGKRVLPAEAVGLGTSNLLPSGVAGPDFGGFRGHFGAGGFTGVGAEAGLFGWAGAAGTVGTVDMARGVRSQIFVQFMPPNALSVLDEYKAAVTADLKQLMETA